MKEEKILEEVVVMLDSRLVWSLFLLCTFWSKGVGCVFVKFVYFSFYCRFIYFRLSFFLLLFSLLFVDSYTSCNNRHIAWKIFRETVAKSKRARKIEQRRVIRIRKSIAGDKKEASKQADPKEN